MLFRSKKVPNAEAERVAKVPKSIVEGQNAAPGTKVALPKVTHTSKYGKTMGKFADGKGEASHTTYDEGKSSTTGAKVSKKGVDVNRSGKTVVPNQGGGDTIHEAAGGLNLSPTGFAVSGSEIVTKRDNKGEELQKLENSGTVAWDGEAATIAGSRMEDGSGIDANVTSDGTYEGTNGSISVASNGNSLGVVKGPDGVGIKASRGQYSGQISAKLSGEDKKVSAEFASSRMAVNTSVAWADDEYAISAGGSINGIGMGASISHEDGTTSGFNESDDGTAGALTASSVSGDGFGVNGSAKAYGVGGAYNAQESSRSSWLTPNEWASMSDEDKAAWKASKLANAPSQLSGVDPREMGDGEQHLFRSGDGWNANGSATVYGAKLGIEMESSDDEWVQATRLGSVLRVDEGSNSSSGGKGDVSLLGAAGASIGGKKSGSESLSMSFDVNNVAAMKAYQKYVEEGLLPGADRPTHPAGMEVSKYRQKLLDVLRSEAVENEAMIARASAMDPSMIADLPAILRFNKMASLIAEMTDALNAEWHRTHKVGAVMGGVQLNSRDRADSAEETVGVHAFGLEKQWKTTWESKSHEYISASGNAEREDQFVGGSESTDALAGGSGLLSTSENGGSFAFASINSVKNASQVKRAERHNNSNVPIGTADWMLKEFGKNGYDEVQRESNAGWMELMVNPTAAIEYLANEPFVQQQLRTTATFNGEQLEEIAKHLNSGARGLGFWKDVHTRQGDYWYWLEKLWVGVSLQDKMNSLVPGAPRLDSKFDPQMMRTIALTVHDADSFLALTSKQQSWFIYALSAEGSKTGTSFDAIGVIQLLPSASRRSHEYSRMAKALQNDAVDETDHGDAGSELLKFRKRLSGDEDLQKMFDANVKVSITDPLVEKFRKFSPAALVHALKENPKRADVYAIVARACAANGGSVEAAATFEAAGVSANQLVKVTYADRARYHQILSALGGTPLAQKARAKVIEIGRLHSDGELSESDVAYVSGYEVETQKGGSTDDTQSQYRRQITALANFSSDRSATAQLVDVIKRIPKNSVADRFKKAGVSADQLEHRLRGDDASEIAVLKALTGSNFYEPVVEEIRAACVYRLGREITEGKFGSHTKWERRWIRIGRTPEQWMIEVGVTQEIVDKAVSGIPVPKSEWGVSVVGRDLAAAAVAAASGVRKN